VVLASQTYGVPLNTGATQKSGHTPLRDLLNQQFNDNDPLEAINSNDSRIRSQVTDLHGILYGATNTTVTSATGPPRVGIAYFVVSAIGTPSGVVATIVHQGYLAADGENVLYPSIAVNRLGLGAMSFTLSGADFFPSAAYVRFDWGLSSPGSRASTHARRARNARVDEQCLRSANRRPVRPAGCEGCRG
jgi:hypothetical protein